MRPHGAARNPKGTTMTTYAYDVAEISARCDLCGAVRSTIVAEGDFARYFCDGVLVQHAFPEATPEAREIAMAYRSGRYVCPACWDAMGEG